MEQDLEKLSKEELIFLLKKKNEKIQKTEIKLQKSKAQAELLAKELAAVRSAVIDSKGAKNSGFRKLPHSFIDTIQAVIVVPTLAPMMTPTACTRDSTPALTKPTTIT